VLESASSLIVCIDVSVVVAHSLGTETYSVESNFIISLGEMEYRNFQVYPSARVTGSESVNVG